jgi:hypothetical protein
MKAWKDLPQWFKILLFSLELLIAVLTLVYFIKDV